MTRPLTPATQASVRQAAQLMGALFINRRDRKAVYRPDHRGDWHWTAIDEPFTMRDFVNHLTDEHCLGTYLLGEDDTVRFMAFDIDVAKEGKFWRIYDVEEIIPLEASGYGFDMDLHQGPLEASLHDPDANAHRWVRMAVLECVRAIVREVRKMDLAPMTVITGGGAHVLVPLPPGTLAADARLVGTDLVSRLRTAQPLNKMFWSWGSLGELTIEVFPKQDRLTGKDYGNLIRLPFGWHHEAAIRTFTIDPEALTVPTWNWNKVPSLPALRGLAAAGAYSEGIE